MPAEYKHAKEAFVADNAGTSLWTVNAVSTAGLSAYALARALARYRGRTDGVTDYLVSFLPLLLGQTAFARDPLRFNGGLLAVALVLFLVPSSATKNGPRLEPRHAPGRIEDDSSDEDAPPIAAKAVPIAHPTRPTDSLRVRIPPSRRGDAHGNGRTSPLPDLPMMGDLARPASASSESASAVSRALPSSHDSASGHRRAVSSHAIEIPASPSPATLSDPRLPPTLHPSAGPSNRHTSTRSHSAGLGSSRHFPPQPFLAVYRAHMMVMTAVAILAVDFPVFPREFGKCEDWGTSLMDIGVGSFVFSQGIVSALPHLAPPASGGSPPLMREVYTALRKCLPVLLLGGIRVLMVKGTEYPEHVTEYGVHWNFFFTLGLMPLCGVFAARARPMARYVVLALVVGVVHQLALAGGAQRWVMSPEREGLLGMNKEGIVSFAGYFAIFLLGLDLGHYLLPPDPYYFETLQKAKRGRSGTTLTASGADRHAHTAQPRRKPGKLALVLASYSAVWWVLLWAMRASGVLVSRRLANLPYVIWITAFNTTFLLGYLAVELAVPVSNSVRATPLLDAINSNGLLVFLAANLLTGLVNISMQTMFAADRMAMLVLGGYTMALSVLAWSLRRTKLRL